MIKKQVYTTVKMWENFMNFSDVLRLCSREQERVQREERRTWKLIKLTKWEIFKAVLLLSHLLIYIYIEVYCKNCDTLASGETIIVCNVKY